MCGESDNIDLTAPLEATENEDASVESLEKAEIDGKGNDSEDKGSSLKPSAAKVPKKKKWKKPKDKPKRPLSAYNIFFRQERENLMYGALPTHGRPIKIGFSDLAKNIAKKWKQLDPDARRIFEIQADFEQRRYKCEVEEWRRIQDGGSPPISCTRSQEPDWSVVQQQQAELSKVLAANVPEILSSQQGFSPQQSRDALINHLVIADLMEKCNQSNILVNPARVNSITQAGAPVMEFMGSDYVNLNMIESQPHFNLGYFSPDSDSLQEMQMLWAASAPRRMSMPTSIEQFAQMQQH